MRRAKNNTQSVDVWCGMEIQPGIYYDIQDNERNRWANDDKVLSDICSGRLVLNDGDNDITIVSQAINFLKDYYAPNPKTKDSRDIIAINRIPLGYTIYPTGQGDALSANGAGAGAELIFDSANKTKRFQLLNHWYGIGARVIWEGADLSDSMSAVLKAPATIGTNEAGDFTKVATGYGFNVYVPTPPGAGNWKLNLAEKHAGTNVLKCVPVPVAGNTGFYDYDSESNTLTVNPSWNGTPGSQRGGYNLYDAELPLFRLAHKCWGRKQDGAESVIEIPDVIGKLLYNQWVIDFTLSTTKTEGIKVGVVLITAVKSTG